MVADITHYHFTLQHSTDAYFKLIKKLAYDHEEHAVNNLMPEISSGFLCPSIDQVKITQYGLNDVIVVVTGQQLWFVHSIKLSKVMRDPFQVQERSVSFRTSMDNLDSVIQRCREESNVVVYSHFHIPVQRKVIIELNVSLKIACMCYKVWAQSPSSLEGQWKPISLNALYVYWLLE